jgi:hypothetical protein
MYDYGIILLLLAGSILAMSGLIIAKKPEAKELINKLVPFQAFIGVGLLGIGVVNVLHWIGDIGTVFKFSFLFGFAIYGTIFSALLLGFFFGMPLIAKWIPGDSPAEEKAEAMAKKVAPFQVTIGIVGFISAILFLLYTLKILKIG